MNTKGIIAVIVIIVLAVIGYKVWGGNGASDTTSAPAAEVPSTPVPAGVTKDTYAPVTTSNVDTSLIGKLKASSVSAAETGFRVALVNGKADFSAEGIKGTIVMGDVAVAKSLGGSDFAIATLGVTTGKTTSQYAVLFQNQGGTMTDKSYALIGTGAKVTGLRADEVSGAIAVSISYSDAAGKAHTKILVIENGMFNAAKEINL